MSSASEHDMVEGCRHGNRKSRQNLFEQTSDRIYGLLLRMTKNADDAFDLSQETYLKAFSQIQKFDGHSSIATWLYRIAVNEALQFLRKAETNRVKLEQNARKMDDGNGQHEAESIRLDMRAALEKIGVADSTILLLRYQEGLDYRAIAEVLECAEGTVASRLSRAREHLRNILQKSYKIREDKQTPAHPNCGR